MNAQLEELEKHRVKLTVDVTPDEAKPIMAIAYKHVGESISVPGFRKGKIPRKIVEAQVGKGAVMQEFVEHALAEFYPQALREHDLAPIGDPEFDDLDLSDVEGAGFRFSATVDIRPRQAFEEADYKGLRVERPEARIAEYEVDEQMDRLRERFAELESVGHPARRGDFVVADLRATIHDEEIPEATSIDELYEVGSGAVVPELDEELEGKRRGDILKFNARLPEGAGEHGGEEVSIQVLVKDVKAKKLPALDDEFAKTASEFDTLDELRDDVREKLGMLKSAAADAAIRDRTLQALIERVDVELPGRLVDQETESRVASTRRRAQEQGTSLDDVLRSSGVDELQFRSDARAHAVRAIRADLALEAVARREGLEVTKEELEGAIAEIARGTGKEPKEVARLLQASGQMTSVAGDIIRTKALDLVVEHSEVVGEDGGAPGGEPPEGEEP
ncbi:MAG TPA: trigger factor [Actinomycetota bacterium]